MKIQAKQVQHIEVEVRDSDLVQHMIDLVLRHFHMLEDDYLDSEGTIMRSFGNYPEAQRKATAEELRMFQVKEWLRAFKGCVSK